jgi:hypothetical protein
MSFREPKKNPPPKRWICESHYPADESAEL